MGEPPGMHVFQTVTAQSVSGKKVTAALCRACLRVWPAIGWHRPEPCEPKADVA